MITAPPGSYTWSSSLGGNWEDTQSWSGQGVPPANGTADIFFTGGTSLGTSAFAPLNLHSLNISGAFTYFNIYANNGAKLTLQSGGLTYAPTTTGVQAQIFIPVILAANQTIATGGDLQLEGNLSGSANLTKTGGGLLEISSDNRPLVGAALPGSPGGAGHMNGLSSTSYSGNITLLQGGLALRSDGALGTGTLTIGPPTTDLTEQS